MRVLPYGPDDAYVDLEAAEAPDRAARTLALARHLREVLPGADVVAGGGVVAVFGASAAEVAPHARSVAPAALPPGRLHTIPVVYDGPDLADVAAHAGISPDEVVAAHAGREHLVEILGFLPGFGYLGPVDPRLAVPRRSAPRPRVPAGSVAVAGGFTGIYPLTSPGGWHLIGRAVGSPLFDPSRERPVLLAAGDRVRFEPVGAGSTAVPGAVAHPPDPGGPGLRIVRVGLALVQDPGRPGRVGAGIPVGGALDPAGLAAANRAVGNPAGAAAIELLGGGIEVVARGAVTVSIGGGAPVSLADGASLHVPEGRAAVRYLAVAGGIDVPAPLGARATWLAAGIGGLGGRLLRRDDVLPVGGGGPDASVDDATEIEVDPGPHLDRFPPDAFDVLLAGPWRLSRLVDRVGARLEGGRVPRTGPDLPAPAPMRRGAVQVTPDGTPIVLGPDHPTTGGYPVLAVVRPSSFGVLARLRPGDPVVLRGAP